MSLGRILVEKLQPDVLEWLAAKAEIVVVDPWAEPERCEREASQVDAVISRKGRITRHHMEASRGRLKVVARTGVGVAVLRAWEQRIRNLLAPASPAALLEGL